MADDGRYLSVETFKAWTRDKTLTDDEMISDAILAAESVIDIDLGRRFEVAAGAATERVYAAESGDTTLFIHDCTEITAVAEDGTTVATADWQAAPLNQLSSWGETVPYTHIDRMVGSWHAERGKATIGVTAKWGWAAIPPSIVVLCSIVAQTMAQHRDMRFGLAAITADGLGVSARDARIVRDTQARYSRKQLVYAI